MTKDVLIKISGFHADALNEDETDEPVEIITSALYYQKNRTKKGALISLLIGTLCMALAGFAVNLWLVIPAYVSIMHFPLEAIIGAGAAIFPVVNSVFMLVLCCTTPFNLIKGILLSILTFLLYKRISPFLK